MDAEFNEHDEWVDGFLARVLQHEIDHLDGKLFIDYISPMRKQLIKKKHQQSTSKVKFVDHIQKLTVKK